MMPPLVAGPASGFAPPPATISARRGVARPLSDVIRSTIVSPSFVYLPYLATITGIPGTRNEKNAPKISRRRKKTEDPHPDDPDDGRLFAASHLSLVTYWYMPVYGTWYLVCTVRILTTIN